MRAVPAGDRWTRLYERAQRKLGPAIRANPRRFQPMVERFIRVLADVQKRLGRMRRAGVDKQKLKPLEARARLLRSGLFGAPRSFEGPPLLVIAGIALGVAAIAWAVAAYQYAVGLRERILLLERELEARVEASKEGRALQPSTLATSSSLPLLAVGAVMLGVVGWAWRGAA